MQAHYALGKGATGGYSVSSLYLNLCAARAVVPSGWVGSGTRDDPYALRLDGYNAEVVIARNGWGLSALSLEAWVRLPAELWGGHGLILSNGSIGYSGSPSRFTLFIAGYGATYVVQTGVNDGGTMYEAYCDLPLNGGGWRHFVSTRAGVGSPMRVYIDGQFVKEGGGKRAVPDDPDPTVVLGRASGTGKPRRLDAPLAAARIYDRPLDAAEVAWLYAAGPEWDKRTASSVTVPLALGNTAWTVAGRYSGRWAHNDSLAHNLLTLYAGADARATIYKHTDNKLYASVNDGTDTAASASAAQTLAADTVNTFVARATWGATVDLSINGVPSTQGDASLVGAQNIDSLVIDGGPSGSIGPLILSPTNKGANWQAAVEAAGFSDLFRLVRDYMAVGDYIVPFGMSSTAYRKVR